MNDYFTRELIRPWKLLALLAGIAVLWVGMHWSPAPDWTPSTIIVMALATHATAPWCADVAMRLRWGWMPVAAFLAWAVVDGSWMLSIDGSEAAWSMREGQWLCSLMLFALYGMLLRPKAPLRSMLKLRLDLSS